MIRISQLKVNIDRLSDGQKNELAEVTRTVCKTLHIENSQIKELHISKKSIDARKKHQINFIYTVDVELNVDAKTEEKTIKWVNKQNVTKSKINYYTYKPTGDEVLATRPIIVGTGPAGLFCAYMLAKDGYSPIVLERGEDVDTRVKDVNEFWETNRLKPESNVQFGEGGAGTFSDGKLNTVVKDELGRNRFIYQTFVKHGAPADILYNNKPHIGTDHLRGVVKSMREEIIANGGEVRFGSKVTDLIIENDKVVGVTVNGKETIQSDLVVLAIGHSARDTFEMIYDKGLTMQSKSFAIGVRMEHPQDMINHSQYGDACVKLPAADYKVTHQSDVSGRGIYSFCMCPGGFVVNSSSEEGHLVVNGMSNYKRDAENANSAIIVQVGPEDFEGDSPLAGVEFQRKWERLAYEAADGKVPVQLYGDLCDNRVTTKLGNVTPSVQGQYAFADLRSCLPDYVTDTIVEGVRYFDKRIPGFANKDAVLVGVETRTSSPVRIVRDEICESNVKGVYPCGEGAGYAGGITSAAIDGMKVYESIAKKYRSENK